MATVTIDGNSYEVYDSYDNVNTYLVAAAHATNWRAVSAYDRRLAMVTATRVLDRQPWQGAKTSDAQPIAWPRTGVTDKFGAAVDSGTIPQTILDGFAELCELQLADVKLQGKTGTVGNVRRVKAGPAEVEFFDSRFDSTRFPQAVHELVGQFLSSAATELGITVTGTSVESSFQNKDYGRTDVGLP